MPIVGRIVRNIIEKILHNEGPKRKIIGSDGHLGQVIPLEEAKIILSDLAAEPIIYNHCPCSIIMRGKKDARCISFGVLSDVIEKLPRYVPRGMKYKISRDEAVEMIEEFNNQGFVHSIYFQPVPYINALCSCDKRDCMAMLGRRSMDLYLLYKGEYVMSVNPDLCDGCTECARRCQFRALTYSPLKKQMLVNQDMCFGCGNCRSVCESGAISLLPSAEVASVAGHY
jgi:ferredoxin